MKYPAAYMAQVFEFNTKRQLTDDEAATKDAEAAEERKRIDEAQEYLAALDEDSVLKVGEEGERDLSAMNMDKVRTVTESVVNRVILDAASKVFDLDERSSKALNNYLQVARVGEIPRPKTGLAIGPFPSPEREKLLKEIRAKKIELLSGMLGERLLESIEGIKRMMTDEYFSDEWTEEVRERMSRVKLHERGAEETLEMMVAIRSTGSSSGEQVRNLREARSRRAEEAHISDLRKAITTGDPASIKGHADRDLEFLAEKERRARGELSKASAKAEMDVLKERITRELVRLNTREVEK